MNVEAKSPWLRMVNGYKNYYCYWLDKQLATRTPYSGKRSFGVAHHDDDDSVHYHNYYLMRAFEA